MTLTDRFTAALNALKGKKTDSSAALTDMTNQRDAALAAEKAAEQDAQTANAAATAATQATKQAQADLASANATVSTLQGQLATIGDVSVLTAGVVQLEQLAAS